MSSQTFANLPFRRGMVKAIEGLVAALLAQDATAGYAWVGALGFSSPTDAWLRLARLTAEVPNEQLAPFLRELMPALALSSTPDMTLVNLVRYAESRFTEEHLAGLRTLAPPSLGLLVHIFGYSQFLADLLIRYPAYLEWLEEDEWLERGRAPEELKQLFLETVKPFKQAEARHDAGVRALRRELLRMGLRRMLDFSDEMELAREMSDLAAASLELALVEITPPLRARFGEPLAEAEEGDRRPLRRARFNVMAMGKLGGRELNFSSDIDLIFVYSDEGETSGADGSGLGRISNHYYFNELAEKLIAYIGAATDEGYFYRVDARLRPDGETGPLARSLAAYEIYYETQARPWERLALLKARAVAGDADLGRLFMQMSQPLVYNPLRTGDIVREMADLKQRIDQEIMRHEGADREIKRGAGGIREIEFLVQTMQMLHGANRLALCVSGTLAALAALALEGLMAEDEARQLAEDYVFLRTVEHRLQMMHLRQTHMLPDDAAGLDALAIRCGMVARKETPPGEQLMQCWREVSARVHQLFASFFNPDKADPHGQLAGPPETASEEALTHLTGQLLWGAPEMTLLPMLDLYGLGSPSALKILRRLGGGSAASYLSSEARDLYATLLPFILRVSAGLPQPEAALANLESFLNASGAIGSFYAIFLSSPQSFELLMLAFGSGNAMAQTLIAHPEYFDYLADPQFMSMAPRPDQMAKRLERWTAGAKHDAQLGAGLARFKRFEFLMAALGELGGLLDYQQSCERITLTARMIIERVLRRGAEELGLGWPLPQFSVLAMGKLGTGELTYQSDLDLIFVWERGFGGEETRPGELAARLGERVTALLTQASPEGELFSVDLRLRPEGNNAPLAPPLERYVEYYGDRAQVWEFQSAMKLRYVAGDAELGGQLIGEVAKVIARRCEGINLTKEIRMMRRRMEENLKLPRWVDADYKVGPGGAVDLEFAAQYLQLRHLRERPELIGKSPAEVFGEMSAAGVLDKAMGQALANDYAWLRRLERRARLLFESEKSYLPTGGEKLQSLERACRNLVAESEHNEGLLPTTAQVMARTRRHFEKLVTE